MKNARIISLLIIVVSAAITSLVSAHIDPSCCGRGSGTRQIAVQVAAANPTPIYAPGNPLINQAGPYGLANDIDGALTIDHDNVTLYMKGHRITGNPQTGYGILVDGKKHIKMCDGTIGPDIPGDVAVAVNIRNAQDVVINECNLINSTQGVLVQDSTNVHVTKCKAQGHTQNGFVLNNCTNSSVNTSIATALTGDQDVAGFYAISGYNNAFNRCTAQTIETTSTQGNRACGIQLETERNTSITNCTVAAINASQGSHAYGIHAPQQLTLNDQETSFEVTALSLLAYNNSAGYLACSTISGAYLTLYSYDLNTGTINPQPIINYFFNTKTYLYATSWYCDSNNIPYLAVCGKMYSDATEHSTGFIQIFQFDPQTQTLTLHGEKSISATDQNIELHALAWLEQNGTPYVAITGKKDATGFVEVFAFTAQTGELALHGEKVSLGSCGYALDWHHASDGTPYIAVGGSDTSGYVKIFSYDASAGTLTPQGEQTTNLGTAVYTVSWHRQGDGMLYLAVGGGDVSGYVKIFTYDLNAASLTLADEQTTELGSTVHTISWAQLNETTLSLAIGGSGDQSGFAKIFIFAPETTTLTYQCTQLIGTVDTSVAAVAWHTNARNKPQLIIGGAGPGFITSYSFDQTENRFSPISSFYGALATRVHSIAGCFDTRNTPYIASVSGKNICVFKYNKLTESLELHGTQHVTEQGSIEVVSWYSDAHGTSYLAVGGGDRSSAFIKIYQYDTTTGTLTLHGEQSTAGSGFNSLSWASDGAPLLTAGAHNQSSSTFICVYEYNSATGVLTENTRDTQTDKTTNTSIAWVTSASNKRYLACGGLSDGFVNIYEYDQAQKTLTKKATITESLGSAVLSIAWYKNNQGSLFLAVGGYNSSDGTTAGYTRIYSYNPEESSTVLIKALTYPSNPSTITRCLAWTSDIEGNAYLTVGVDRATSMGTPGFIVHYLFESTYEPYLTEQWAFDTIAKPLSLFWRLNKTDAPLLAVGGGDADPLGFLALYGQYPAGCLIKNNTVTSVQGGLGIGVEANSCYNYVIGNLTYANENNYGTDVHGVHVGRAAEPTQLANISL